jgi:hypothetical protein
MVREKPLSHVLGKLDAHKTAKVKAFMENAIVSCGGAVQSAGAPSKTAKPMSAGSRDNVCCLAIHAYIKATNKENKPPVRSAAPGLRQVSKSLPSVSIE